MPLTFFGLGRPSAEAPNRVGPVQAEILRVIRDMPEKAHGVGIAEILRGRFDDTISDAQTYIAIRRLEVRGMICELTNKPENPPTPSIGQRGRPRKLYSLTASGRRALEDEAATRNSLARTDAQQRGTLYGAKKKGPTPLVGAGVALRGDVA